MIEIKIAIIDDGVSSERFDLAGSWIIDDDLTLATNSSCENDEYSPSHADICLSIVQKYINCEHILFYSIKILNDETKRGNINKLLKALELCEFLNIKLIHLSIGTTYYQDFTFIQGVVRRLLDRGIIIVSATSNEGIVTYPAYVCGVIGVKCDPILKNDEYAFQVDPIERVCFRASSRHQIMLNCEAIQTETSNSYAAPTITAKAISHLINNPLLDSNEMYKLLIQSAVKAYDKVDLYKCESEYVDIPVVVISGFDAPKLLNIICELADCLKFDDYNYRVALEHHLSEALDLIPIDSHVDIERFVQRMNAYFNCEIIILGFVSPIAPSRCKNADVWVWNNNRHTSYKQDLSIEQIEIISEHESGKEIYKKMLSILT